MNYRFGPKPPSSVGRLEGPLLSSDAAEIDAPGTNQQFSCFARAKPTDLHGTCQTTGAVSGWTEIEAVRLVADQNAAMFRRIKTRATLAAAITLSLALVVGCSTTASQSARLTSTRPVVFVCEHGAARSVIAAAWFNKLAAEQHVAFRAVARGVTPQEDLSVSTVAGLKRDGIEFSSEKPSILS